MISEAAAARLARLPHIKRARGFRLYAPRDRRILDLYQDGGRSMLGHRPGKLIHDVKNALERGALSPFPSPEGYRLKKIVAALIEQTMPRRVCDEPLTHEHVVLYPTIEAALDAIRGTGGPLRLWDPVAVIGGQAPGGEDGRPGDAEDREVWLWRPELPEAVWSRRGAAQPEAVIVLLPLPSIFSVVPVVVGEPPRQSVPPLPEPSLRAATLVTHMTLRLERREEPLLAGFHAMGPYLTMADGDHIDEITYETRFLRFLERDILISPERCLPSVYPREMSEGEQKKLERAAREIIGGQNGQ